MEYTKIENKGYNLHIIKTDKFKNINVKFNFRRPIKKEELTIRNFVNDILIQSTKKYPSVRDIVIETEELYCLEIGTHTYKSGRYNVMSFSEKFLNETYTEEGMLEKSIKFLIEVILNPDVINNEFKDVPFNQSKETLYNYITSIKENPAGYSKQKLYEVMDSEASLSFVSAGYLDDLEKINKKNLYEYYLDVIKNDNIDIFIIGNVEVDTVNNIFKKYLELDERKRFTESPIIKNELVREVKEEMEVESLKQSKLSIGIKLYDLEDFERKYVLTVLSFIMGGSCDSKLFNKVRKDNSLCYYISASTILVHDDIIIASGINACNYDKVIKLIKEVIDSIKAGNITDEDIKKAKITYINGCKELSDSPISLISTYVSHEYLGNDLLDEKMQKIDLVTKEMVITVANKMRMDSIFLLKGEENDNATK